jgi:hypothetical protein
MVRHSPGQHHALSTPKLTRLFPGALLVFFILLGWEVPAGASRQKTYDLYLPVVFASGMPCPIDSLINGDFEADDLGWTLYTTGIDWKAHDLVGSIAEGFSPHQGNYAARLGGYEGVYDWIEQPITIPAQSTLSYWWRLGTYEPAEPPHDNFLIELLEDDGTRLAVLAAHHDREPEGVWAQDVIDLNSYAGQTLKLRFSSYNDNYYFSWFDLDEVKLCAWE